jgi:hypothetical protein
MSAPPARQSLSLLAVMCASVLALPGCGSTPATSNPVEVATPSRTQPADTASVPNAAAPTPADVRRYCQLADELDNFEAADPDPKVLAQQAATQLAELPQAAPPDIRDAVTTYVDSIRADAGVPGVGTPDDATLTQAEATKDTFENANCP